MRHRMSFNPLVYASQEDAEALRLVFSTQNVEPWFEITAFRQPYRSPQGIEEVDKPRVWAVELPLGAFSCDFRNETLESHCAERDRLIKLVRNELQAVRAMLDKRKDYFVRDNLPYYRRVALEHIRHAIEKPAYVNAVITFLRRAEEDPYIVTGAPKPRRPHLTLDERVKRFGHLCKGPAWTPEEDAVLRTWFGVRTLGEHAGRHALLTDDEWTRVLELLGNMRTKNAVKVRLTALNNMLRDRMLVNGYLPRDQLREYMQQALGEMPRRPPMRPYTKMRRVPRENRSRRKDPRASRSVLRDAGDVDQAAT